MWRNYFKTNDETSTSHRSFSCCNLHETLTFHTRSPALKNTNLQVVIGWHLFFQEHLSQDFISISHTLHQLLPPVCSLSTKLCRDLIIADSLTAGRKKVFEAASCWEEKNHFQINTPNSSDDYFDDFSESCRSFFSTVTNLSFSHLC